MVLIVEDDPLIAADMAARVRRCGHEALGPALSIAEAEALIAAHAPHAALLDGDVDGQSSTPLAGALAARGVRVAFCTGMDRIIGLPDALKSAPVLKKPASDEALEQTLKELMNSN